MTPERYSRIVNVLNKRQPDLTVITDEVHKGRNVAAIIRTCDAVGIDNIHVVIPKAGFQNYRGTALGSEKWVEVALHENVATPIHRLQNQGFQVVAAHLSDTAVDYRTIDYTRPTAVLLGTERHGPSKKALDDVDTHITIPMLGMVASYNVSVAAAIIMAEASQQRQQSGLYDQPRLAESIYKERLFCWCHPVLADYCHKHNLDYPELNEKGDLIEGPSWYRRVREELNREEGSVE